MIDQNYKLKKIPHAKHLISLDLVSKSALKVIDILDKEGFKTYLVGGCVRDLLLGNRPKDFDIATDALPTDIKSLFRNCRIIGRRFRLVHVVISRDILEVATFRASGNQILGLDGQIVRDNVYGTIEQDAYRRDFSVNALYYDPQSETVLDFANGFKDLKNKVLRIIGDPKKRYREDPVRMLRAIRFIGKLQQFGPQFARVAINVWKSVQKRR